MLLVPGIGPVLAWQGTPDRDCCTASRMQLELHANDLQKVGSHLFGSEIGKYDGEGSKRERLQKAEEVRGKER